MTHKCQLWSVDNIVHFFHQGKGELFLLALKKTNFPILSAKLHLLIEFSFVKMTDLPLLGFMYNNISDDEKINIKRNAGIQVSIVYKDSPAYYANIVRGDIIIGINDIEIRNSDEFCELMKKFKKGDNITLTVIRQYQETKITYKL